MLYCIHTTRASLVGWHHVSGRTVGLNFETRETEKKLDAHVICGRAFMFLAVQDTAIITCRARGDDVLPLTR